MRIKVGRYETLYNHDTGWVTKFNSISLFFSSRGKLDKTSNKINTVVMLSHLNLAADY